MVVAAVGDTGTPGADGDATGAVKPTRLTAEARSYQQLLQRRWRWYARGLAPEMGAPGDGGGGHGKCGCGDADVVRVEERNQHERVRAGGARCARKDGTPKWTPHAHPRRQDAKHHGQTVGTGTAARLDQGLPSAKLACALTPSMHRTRT